VAADPDARGPAPALARDAEARACLDDRGFERPYERNDFTKALEPANRIDDELPRPVVRHVPAALDRHQIDAASRKLVGGEKDVLALRLPAQRDDRRVF